MGPTGTPHGDAPAAVSLCCPRPRRHQHHRSLRKGQRYRAAAALSPARVETPAAISSPATAAAAPLGAGGTGLAPAQPLTPVIHPPEKPVWAVTPLPHARTSRDAPAATRDQQPPPHRGPGAGAHGGTGAAATGAARRTGPAGSHREHRRRLPVLVARGRASTREVAAAGQPRTGMHRGCTGWAAGVRGCTPGWWEPAAAPGWATAVPALGTPGAPREPEPPSASPGARPALGAVRAEAVARRRPAPRQPHVTPRPAANWATAKPEPAASGRGRAGDGPGCAATPGDPAPTGGARSPRGHPRSRGTPRPRAGMRGGGGLRASGAGGVRPPPSRPPPR